MDDGVFALVWTSVVVRAFLGFNVRTEKERKRGGKESLFFFCP